MALGSAPAAQEWLHEKAGDMHEEDQLADALAGVVDDRGVLPAHAPRSCSPGEAAKLKSMLAKLDAERNELEKARRNGEKKEQELQKREAEVVAIEERLHVQREHEKARNDYPRPEWLPDVEGTVNVGITGNSGVGKSLLINALRRVRPQSSEWAPVDIKETTMRPTMYTFPGEKRARVWDLPGAGTENFPLCTYIQAMGLRYFDCVIIVTAGRFTSTEVQLSAELNKYGIPYQMVRTKIDLDIYNDKEDNFCNEEAVVMKIRKDLRDHGVEQPYLVSSREPEKYDMRQLLCDLFPGLKERVDASTFLFGDQSGGWQDNWALPSVISQRLSAMQGHWRGYDHSRYIVDSNEVHITSPDGSGQAVVTLIEDGDKIWIFARWFINDDTLRSFRQSGELRWTPVDLKEFKPLIWKWQC
jgi:GTP-binding protein EngB required for normal cell division